MFTLFLVSQKNLPITVALVSTPLRSTSPRFPYRPEGPIYHGGVWYVALPSTREIITQFASPLKSQFPLSVNRLSPEINGTTDCHL